MRRHLESFTFTDFTEFLEKWLKSGRVSWYICGNLDSATSIEIVEDVRNTLGLEDIKVEDLADVRVITLENNSASLIE